LFGATTINSNYNNTVVVAGKETPANKADVTEGGNFQIGDGNGGLARVTNSAAGTWNITTGNLTVGSDQSSSFANAGLFENSGSNNSTVVNPVFNSTGTIDVVNAGTSITFEGGGSLVGTLAGAGTIALDEGVFTIASGIKLSVMHLPASPKSGAGYGGEPFDHDVSDQIGGARENDAKLREPGAGGDQGGLPGGEGKADAAAGIFQNHGLEAGVDGIFGGVGDAEIRGEACEEDAGEGALAQIGGQARRRAAVVFGEGGVAVDLAPKTLADNHFDARGQKIGVKCGVGRGLECVVGPEGLFAVGHVDFVVGAASGMHAGEREVARRVPILRRNGVGEMRLQEVVGGGHDRVAIRHRQFAAWHEGGLDVDQGQNVRRCDHDLAHAWLLRQGMIADSGGAVNRRATRLTKCS
jgi:hypothetical protein